MHASYMLDEQILAVEIVRFAITIWAEIASPETKTHVLCVDMSFPFVLGAKGGSAAIYC